MSQLIQGSLNSLKPGSHVHLMGICGTAMASLAGLLKDRGFKVTGSDSHPYPPMSTQIESLGIAIQKPYQASNLNPCPDFVIVGNVISAQNEEALEMVRLQIPCCSLPQAMGEFIIAERKSFVVSGTHGKTTTTSLLSWVLDRAGYAPGFLIGGIPKNFSQSFRNPAQDVFVIEGDEYDTAYFDKVPKFIHYRPQYVILSSVEFDHADIYADFNAVKAAFRRLMSLIPPKGRLIYWGDDQNVCEVAHECTTAEAFSFGFKSTNHFICREFNIVNEKTEFTVTFQNKNQSLDLGVFTMELTGKYNVLNALSVIAQTYLFGVQLEQIKEALASFSGVKRRQEILGEPGGILLIEDFAHHPTAVKETVAAIQNKYAQRKVFSVFEPRSATSRRKVFQKDYVEAFSRCHEVILAEAFDQGKISEENRFSSAELSKDLTALDVKNHVFRETDEIVSYLKKQAKKGDVILIMSNGGFGGIYQKLLQTL